MSEPSQDTHERMLHVCSAHLRAVRHEAREVDFVASTDAVDSYDEVVRQNWRLERFNKNPVILWAHNSRELPIGQGINTRLEKGQLVTTIRFASEKANPRAEQVWQGIQEGTIRAVSVGFIAHSYKWEKQDDNERLVLDDNELLEISVTPVPANPEALAKLRARAKAMAVGENIIDAFKSINGNEGGCYQPHNCIEPSTNATKAPADARDTSKESAMSAETEKLVSEKAALEVQLSTEKLGRTALEAQVKDLEGKLSKLETEKQALQGQADHLAKERDAQKERAEKAEGSLIEGEVALLVGEKITAAEKDAFVELRKTNKSLFDTMIAQRGPLNLKNPVIPVDTNAVAVRAGTDVNDLHAKALKAAEAEED